MPVFAAFPAGDAPAVGARSLCANSGDYAPIGQFPSQILDVRRIGRPVRADAAGHELTAALQHRSDADAIPLPMMHRFEVQPTVHP